MTSYFDQTANTPVLVAWFSRLLDLFVHFRMIMKTLMFRCSLKVCSCILIYN